MGIQFHSFNQIVQSELKKKPIDILLISNLSLFLHRPELKLLKALLDFENSDPFKNYKFGDYAAQYLEIIFPNSKIDILDHSDYENANLIGDLNLDLTKKIKKRYDLIIEGGTLEHIFNFPKAISNINSLLKIGGTLYLCTPANNQCGHGFYQFSPELFFRLYSEGNGFKLNSLQLVSAKFLSVELTSNRYLVTPIDPCLTGKRTQFLSSKPVMMNISATKISTNKTEIQQSDYVSKWKNNYKIDNFNFFKYFLKTNLPLVILNQLKGFWESRTYSLKNKKIFKK